jgi:hypothetical protein
VRSQPLIEGFEERELLQNREKNGMIRKPVPRPSAGAPVRWGTSVTSLDPYRRVTR